MDVLTALKLNVIEGFFFCPLLFPWQQVGDAAAETTVSQEILVWAGFKPLVEPMMDTELDKIFSF